MATDEQDNNATTPRTTEGPGDTHVNPFGIVLLVGYLLAVFVVAFYILIKIWPRCVMPPAAAATQQQTSPQPPQSRAQGGSTPGAPGGTAGGSQTAPPAGGQTAAPAGGQTAAPAGVQSAAPAGVQSAAPAGAQTAGAPAGTTTPAGTSTPAPGPSPQSSTQSTPSPCDNSAAEEVYLFWRTFRMWPERRLLLMVILTGALGGLLHSIRSVFWYVGNRELVTSWVLMYLLLPFSSALVGFAFYLVIRGGFFPQAPAEQSSPIGFAALSLMVGLFSSQAVLKLKDVFETLFVRPKAGTDNKPQGTSSAPPAAPPTPGPAPTVSKLSSTSGRKNDEITITGTNFSAGASVLFGTVAATSVEFVNSTTLKAKVPDVTGTVEIAVKNKDGQSAKASDKFTIAP